MRISQLSQRAGLPVGTVKFYLRTGLLHPGRATSATQAVYDATHLQRLRLVRALFEVGGLSHAEIQRVLDAIADPSADALDLATQMNVAAAAESPCDKHDLGDARSMVEQLGWQVDAGSPHLRDLADALHALESIGAAPSPERLKAYADAAADLAREDLSAVTGADDEARPIVAAAVTVLYGPFLRALRRLATEHQSASQTTPARVPAPRQPQPEGAKVS